MTDSEATAIAGAAASEIETLFELKDDDGAYLYSTAELEHFLAAFALVLVPDQRPPVELAVLIAKAVSAAGVSPDDDPSRIREALVEYYEANPPHPGLIAAANRIVRSAFASASSPDVVRAAASKIIGTVQSRLLSSDETPEGSVRAGPLARFSLSDD